MTLSKKEEKGESSTAAHKALTNSNGSATYELPW